MLAAFPEAISTKQHVRHNQPISIDFFCDCDANANTIEYELC